MTRVNVANLPKKVRDKILAQAELAPNRSSTAKSRKGTSENVPCPGSCSCGDRFATAAAWVRHKDAQPPMEGHRWQIDLPTTPGATP